MNQSNSKEKPLLKEVMVGQQVWYQYGEDQSFFKNIEEFKRLKKEEFQQSRRKWKN